MRKHVTVQEGLAEASQAPHSEGESVDLPAESVRERRERRHIFIVRLTVDEYGERARGEIEHAQSGKREPIRSLDGQRLAAFIRGCIRPEKTAEPPNSAVLASREWEIETLEPKRQAADLIILNVRVFRIGMPGGIALILNPEEDFVVEARFQLRRAEAIALANRELTFEMRVFACEVTSGKRKLLAASSQNLAPGVLEYTPKVEVSGLPPDLYRLVTFISLSGPVRLAAYYKGPIIHVSVGQPTGRPIAHTEDQLIASITSDG